MFLTKLNISCSSNSSSYERGAGSSLNFGASNYSKDYMDALIYLYFIRYPLGIDEFESQQFRVTGHKTLFKLYLDEQRLDTKTKLDTLSFQRANWLQYPELAHMTDDILSTLCQLSLRSKIFVLVAGCLINIEVSQTRQC